MSPTTRLVYDVECYKNFWCVTFYCPDTGRVRTFRLTPDGPPLDVSRLLGILKQYLLISFNGNNYDMPMITLALTGASPAKLKELSDRIIVGGLKHWEFEREYGLRIPKVNHIDVMDVAPGMVGLKLYGARLHAPKLQDLPYEPDAILTDAEIEEVVLYNVNDLKTTWLLHQSLVKQIELRERMRDQAGVDLRSKKDAQVAAAVLKFQIEKLQGKPPEKPTVYPGTSFKYDPPAYLSYETETMRTVLAEIVAADFKVLANGKTLLPKSLEGRDIDIGGAVYRMGIGGLHSQESQTTHFADEQTLLVDRDADSYYPNMMLKLGLTPRHLGRVMLDVLGGVVSTRMEAKRSKNKVVADSLKIVVNSTFGMTGSKYSFLYDPKVMIQTTVTGQLLLMWLVEQAFLADIQVVSANTDGIVVKLHPDRLDDWNAVIARWEAMTSLTTEETRYSALYSRDVNNYIAVKEDGEVKTKGAYADPGAQKNPANEICVKAVVDYLTTGKPIADTIRGCTDLTQFLTARQVTGGAYYSDGTYLGKVVRWYLARGSEGFIRTKKLDPRTGNWKTVPKSTGCRPMMDLPDEFPADLDYDRYIAEAHEILIDVGYRPAPPPPLKFKIRKADARPALLAWMLAA